MNLSEMKRVLAGRGIQLTKSLGQNFMHDGNQLRRMTGAAGLSKSDRVIEVGPGLGPLTELLVESAGEVLAIEMDRRLADYLEEKFGSRICLVRGDALNYLRREERDWSEWKLVANLPYSVASPILVELARARQGPRRMTVTLQSEVARRLAARAEEEDYGILSLLVQLHYEPAGHFKIPADCFFPAPEIESTCITLERRSQPLLAPELHGKFERLVKCGFSQRRKMMLKLLKQHWNAAEL